MKAKIEKDILYIEIEINKPPVPSASGKTLVVASTRGNIATDVMVDGKPLTIGLNKSEYLPIQRRLSGGFLNEI